jgi:Domain of unknown function (DUF5615)
VAGLGIRLFMDEMVHKRLAESLRDLGYDAVSCQEAGRANQGYSDEEQLAYATSEGRAILTFNMVDFFPLDRAWKAIGRSHAGIVVSPAIEDFGTLLRAVRRHLESHEPERQHDLLLWL